MYTIRYSSGGKSRVYERLRSLQFVLEDAKKLFNTYPTIDEVRIETDDGGVLWRVGRERFHHDWTEEGF